MKRTINNSMCIILLFTFFGIIGCGRYTIQLENNLKHADTLTTLNTLPPIISSVSFDILAAASKTKDDLYSDIAEAIILNTSVSNYPMRNKFVKNLAGRGVRTLNGLEIKRINNNFVLISYNNGHYTGISIDDEASTKTEFPISIEISNGSDASELNTYGLTKYNVIISIRQIQKSTGGIPAYAPVDSDENLLADLKNIFSKVSDYYVTKNGRMLLEAHDKFLSYNTLSDKIQYKMDNYTKDLYNKHLFYIDIQPNIKEDLQNIYYTLKLRGTIGFKVVGQIYPNKFNYSDIIGNNFVNISVNVDSITTTNRSLLSSCFSPMTFKYKNFSIVLEKLSPSLLGTQVTIVVKNDTKEYIKMNNFSLYLLGCAFNSTLNDTVPPFTTMPINLSIKNDFSPVMNTYNAALDKPITSKLFEQKIGISIQYEINKKILSDNQSQNMVFIGN